MEAEKLLTERGNMHSRSTVSVNKSGKKVKKAAPGMNNVVRIDKENMYQTSY